MVALDADRRLGARVAEELELVAWHEQLGQRLRVGDGLRVREPSVEARVAALVVVVAAVRVAVVEPELRWQAELARPQPAQRRLARRERRVVVGELRGVQRARRAALALEDDGLDRLACDARARRVLSVAKLCSCCHWA